MLEASQDTPAAVPTGSASEVEQQSSAELQSPVTPTSPGDPPSGFGAELQAYTHCRTFKDPKM